MVEITELRYGSIIEDGMGNRYEVVAFGDDATDKTGRELLSPDSAGEPSITANNITGRGMSGIRQDMLYTYDLVEY